MKRRFIYLLLVLVCFTLCVLIVKLFSSDLFIRGLIGDFIVVIMIYCFIKCIVDVKPVSAAVITLVLAYSTELLQYLKLIDYLGLEHSRIARFIIGSTFDPYDLIAYTLGVGCVYLLDTKVIRRVAKAY